MKMTALKEDCVSKKYIKQACSLSLDKGSDHNDSQK